MSISLIMLSRHSLYRETKREREREREKERESFESKFRFAKIEEHLQLLEK